MPSVRRKYFFRVITALFLAALIATFLNLQLLGVSGRSMFPTLEDGQRVLVEKLSYRLIQPGAGDVVVLQLRDEDDLFAAIGGGRFIKRVIAVAGDTVRIEDGTVFVNGNPLVEPYAPQTVVGDMDVIEVPGDHFFVLGDNRNDTEDSRDWGPLPRNRIVGRMLFGLP